MQQSIEPQLFKEKIVLGFPEVEEYLSDAAPIAIKGKPMTVSQMDGPSVVWIVDKLSNILQRLCIQIKNVPNLQRVLIHVTDAKDLASVIKNNSYRFLFEHPSFRVAVLDTANPPDLKTWMKLFAATPWDATHETEFLFAFDERFKGHEEWINQIRENYTVIRFLNSKGLGDSAYTLDTLKGFQNILKNLPEMLKSPDLRNLRGAFKNFPALLVGAGPSVQDQLPYIKSIQDRILIIAADTMLKPLTKAGIRPHMIASIERADGVVGLLDDNATHAETLLVASAVLNPICFEKYSGPRSLYPSLIPESPYFPFRRLRMESGHSCMGLAMNLSSLLGCDPIYLAGIDLCWSESGSSHMESVPYLKEDFYKELNTQLYADSIEARNQEGRVVRTNKYWTMFKHQFENWIGSSKSKIYNLSRQGLALEGAPLASLENIQLKSASESLSAAVMKKLEYDETKTTREAISNFIHRSTSIAQDLNQLASTSPPCTPKEFSNRLKSHPLYAALLSPLLESEIFNLESADSKKATASLSALSGYLQEIATAYSSASADLKPLLSEQKKLY